MKIGPSGLRALSLVLMGVEQRVKRAQTWEQEPPSAPSEIFHPFGHGHNKNTFLYSG